MRLSKSLFKAALPAAVLILLLVAVLNLNAILDWWRLRGYQPPSEVAALATSDTMTPSAKHLFFINHPQLESNGAQFQRDCTVTEQTIVLGCYRDNEDGIFIYNVTDPRLNGVKEVTAAHEMLHAAYERLSKSDKARINQLLVDYFNNDLHDQRIINTMKDYQQSESKDVINEMHSVFGTEISNLPTALENYYQRYFSDRQAVVAYSSNYENEFTSRVKKVQQYKSQLDALKPQINSQEAAVRSQLAKIDADRARLDSLRASGNTSEYNAQVPVFNAEVDAYNAAVSRLKSDIATYNQIVDAYNQLATEIQGLYQAIEALPPAQTQ